MTTYSNLKYDHPFSTNATGVGSLTLISSQTASASASISFTSGIDSTYDEYIFQFINMHPATDAVKFTFQCSTDGGSNYNTTITTTHFQAWHSESGTDNSLLYSDGNDLAQSTSFQEFNNQLGNDNDQSISGTLHLFAPSSTTYIKHFLSRFNEYFSGDYSIQFYVAGYFNTTSAINAIQFKMSSGNIDSGTILMYGVK